MKTSLKSAIITAAIITLTLGKSFGAMNVTKNPLTGELTYQTHFKVNANMSDEQAFSQAQKWFTGNPDKFMRGSKEDGSTTWNKTNKTILDEAFTNQNPLQSVDPSSNWVAGRGMMKYDGGEFSSIGQMYIEYYVIVETHNHEVFVTISHIKYHHFNTLNYAPQVVPNSYGRPFASTNGFEALVSGSGPNRDINNLSDFLTNDLTQLVNDLNLNLNGGNTLRASK